MYVPYRCRTEKRLWECPSGCCRIIKTYRYCQSNNSAIFVENRSFQIVPKQKGAMNTLISGMGVPCTGTPIPPLMVI